MASVPAPARTGTDAAAAAPAALEVAGLSYAYGRRRALDDVSFTLDGGRFALLFGLNGAGKTTLFSLLTRLFTAPQGRIRILGHDLERQPGATLARLGVVFQQSTLDLDLTVRQNLEYHAALHGLGRAVTRARIAEELERNGLADRARDRVRALSGGQRRRVEIARALLHRPDLLLLDEPTVGLDVRSRQDIEAHVRTLCATDGLAVLWATHLTDEASPGDRLVVLHRGRLCFDGTVAGALAARGGGDLRAAFMALIGEAE
ncbi:ABC transporter ATP-binding protein [Azospirillum halopraeferens]|uniref:ABC transporter ATP-binding protein n=1 Tax=Azospirillum halopraeferens TaxID=34010 RepID=UPI000424096A|nr:ABC transporter ATP-binding protein [Azospirillum halopraeferens]